jgi:hypothetical protein
MRRQLALAVAVLLAIGNPALAKDRPLTDDKRVKLTAAVAAEGCSGGKMEFDIDDNHFEVDDAKCNDGREYDLDFDTSFKLIKKIIGRLT